MSSVLGPTSVRRVAAVGGRSNRGPCAVLAGLLLQITLAALSCGVLRAEPAGPPSRDKPAALDKMSGVVVQRNGEGQVERVTIRSRKVDSQIVAAMGSLGSLRDLEVHDAEVTDDAWRALPALRQLRRLSLFDTPVDFAALHQMLADNPRLTVDPWPVRFLRGRARWWSIFPEPA